MSNNIVIFGNSVSINTILIVGFVCIILFILFQSEHFINDNPTNCSDLKSGECTSELCAQLSFCRPQKQDNSTNCTCIERKSDD